MSRAGRRLPKSLAPLRFKLFRWLWIATIASNIGTWMKDVGVGWLMTTLSPTPMMVSLVQVASSLPIFLLSIPAGALADLVDRRKLILFTQLWMVVVSLAMTIIGFAGGYTPWSLLAASFVLALGSALNAPAWQAIIPEMVPRHDFPAAAALNSAGFNLARAVGPALGGFIVALSGSSMVFLLNAVSYLGVIAVLSQWKRHPHDKPKTRRRFKQVVMQGLSHVRKTPALRAVFIRGFTFIVFASALWAHIPLMAKHFMNGSPASYGILLACFGVGAVAGAALLPWARAAFTTHRMVAITTVLFAIAAFLSGHTESFPFLCVAVWVAGLGWLMTLATFNISVQAAVHDEIRARAISLYLLLFFGGSSLGSYLWGMVASHTSISHSLTVSSIGLLVSLPLVYHLKVSELPAGLSAPTIHDPVTPVDIPAKR